MSNDDMGWLDENACQDCGRTARALQKAGELGLADDGVTLWCTGCDGELGDIGDEAV